MSEDFGGRSSRIGGRVLVPSIISFVLLLVLAGLLAAVWIGLTTEPEPKAATPAADAPHAEAPTGDATRESAGVSGSAPPEVPQPEPRSLETAGVVESPEPRLVPSPPPPPAVPAPEANAPPDAQPPAAGNVATAPPPPPVTIPAPRRTSGSLPPAPDPALVEQSSFGPLPRIGPNGREPWQVYARPDSTRDDRPRVAVILSGLGLSSAATEAAIQELPGEVTLAFQPFADNIQQWIRLARAAGHEVLLNLPMEPVDFPESDPGPRALFVTLSPDENEERLRWALSRVSGYVGVVNHMGSRFTTSREAMQPVLAELKARGLLYVDARASARSVATVMASEMRVPRAINDRFLDAREVSRLTIDARLNELERIAQDAGVSIAIGQAFPVTIERVREWAKTLNSRGLTLVPVSAVVDKQADR